MDVGGPVPQALGHDQVAQPDDGGFGGRGHDVSRLAGAPGPPLERLEGLDELADAAEGPVVGVDGPSEVGGRGDEQADPVAGGAGQQSLQFCGRLGHGNVDMAVGDGPRRGRGRAAGAVLSGKQIEGERLGCQLPEVGDGQLEILAQDPDEDVLVDRAGLDQEGAELGGRLGLLFRRPPAVARR